MGIGLNADAGARWNVEVEVLDAETGALLETRRTHNIITTLGLTEIARRVALVAPTGPDYFVVGTGDAPAELGDTALETETYSAPIAASEGGSAGSKFRFTVPSTQCNSTTITECGLENYSEELLARAVLEEGIAKTSGVVLRFTWTWTFFNKVVNVMSAPSAGATSSAGVAPSVTVA